MPRAVSSPIGVSSPRRARRFLSGAIAALHLLTLNHAALALEQGEATELLRKAETLKTSDYAAFVAILNTLDGEAEALSSAQKEQLQYYRAWQIAYEGDYTGAIPFLESLTGSQDKVLQLRARATLVNVLSIAKHYEQAFAQMRPLLDLIPQVSDQSAREQALGVAALLYNQVGQYDSGLSYAHRLAEAGVSDRGFCAAEELRLEALYRSGALKTVGLEFQRGIDACVRSGELVFANLIRSFVARLHIEQKRYDEAVKLLSDHYDETRRTRYARLISEYDALLATAYRETGNSTLAREYALRTIDNGVKNHYTEPLVTAYRLLYVLAKEQGDARDALMYHEKYAAADKGYLDDISAQQLAYQRVSHDALADKLRIDTLNKENQVLQLQRALDKKAVETSGLYITLLIIVLLSIALWAYRTKRSQLHFMRLSQVDGLTGIANRPRFIELAESALEAGTKSTQEVCVVLCDLDHFKSINDRHGHAAGDFVLKQTVAACQLHLRGSDVFGRFGGEEFGIVLPGCNLHDARLRAEQLRLAIAAISSSYDGVELTVSASFGVASTASSSYELRQLLADADAALYRAKHAGRDCVVLHELTPARRLLAGEAAKRWQAGGGDAAGEPT